MTDVTQLDRPAFESYRLYPVDGGRYHRSAKCAATQSNYEHPWLDGGDDFFDNVADPVRVDNAEPSAEELCKNCCEARLRRWVE